MLPPRFGSLRQKGQKWGNFELRVESSRVGAVGWRTRANKVLN